MSKHPTRGYEMLYADKSQYADLVGTVVTGRCVTSYLEYTGTIAEVLVTNGSGDVRYRLVDTGEFYSGGRPIDPIVHGVARLASEPS